MSNNQNEENKNDVQIETKRVSSSSRRNRSTSNRSFSRSSSRTPYQHQHHHQPSHNHRRFRSRTRSISKSSLHRSRSPIHRSRSPIGHRSSRNTLPYRSYPPENPERLHPARNDVLAVFGLDRDATEHHLYHLYKRYGCKKCKVIFDKKTNKPRGFGFVYFSNVEDAVKAKHSTNGYRILTREIRVDYSIGEKEYLTSTRPYDSVRHNGNLHLRPSRYSTSDGYHGSSSHNGKYNNYRGSSDYSSRYHSSRVPSRTYIPGSPKSLAVQPFQMSYKSGSSGHYRSYQSGHRSTHKSVTPPSSSSSSQLSTNNVSNHESFYQRQRSRSRSVERYRRGSPIRIESSRHEYRR